MTTTTAKHYPPMTTTTAKHYHPMTTTTAKHYPPMTTTAKHYPPGSHDGCEELGRFWEKLNISATATTDSLCDSVNHNEAHNTKVILKKICDR